MSRSVQRKRQLREFTLDVLVMSQEDGPKTRTFFLSANSLRDAIVCIIPAIERAHETVLGIRSYVVPIITPKPAPRRTIRYTGEWIK